MGIIQEMLTHATMKKNRPLIEKSANSILCRHRENSRRQMM